jgi:hypothetical protein
MASATAVRVGPITPQRHLLERDQRLVDVSLLAHLVGQAGERGQWPGAGPGPCSRDLAGPRQPEPVPRVQVQRLGLIKQPQHRLWPAQVVVRPRGTDQPLPALGGTGAQPGRGGQRRGLFRDRPAPEGAVRGSLQPSGHLLVLAESGRRPVPHLTVRRARQRLRQGPVHDLPRGQPGCLTHRRPHQRMPEPHALPVHLGQPRRHRLAQIRHRRRLARHHARRGQHLRQRVPVVQCCRQQRGAGHRRQPRQPGRERFLQAPGHWNPPVQGPAAVLLAGRHRQLDQGQRIAGRLL